MELPVKKDPVTSHIDSSYNKDTKIFSFVYKIDDDGFDVAIDIAMKDEKYSQESAKDLKVIFSLFEEEIFNAFSRSEKEDHTDYFCHHAYYGTMLAHGIIINFIYKYKTHVDSFLIKDNDC